MSMKKYLFFLIALFLFTPALAKADVLINEVAWMGVSGANGQYGEWVELYNNGTTGVSLSGWTLAKAGGSKLIFTFSKTISAGGYLVVERTTASMPDALPSITDESGSFGNGGLSNIGEDLVLKDASGKVVDSLDFASGWPAGDNTTKETMQFVDGSWVSGEPTPDAANQGESNTDNNNNDTLHIAGSTLVNTNTQDVHPTILSPIVTKIITSQKAVTGIPTTFSEMTTGTKRETLDQGRWVWNFGDGTSREDIKDPGTFTHTFAYSGDYVVTLEYYETVFVGSLPDAVARTTVSVITPRVVISHISYDAKGGIELSNTSGIDMDISGWTIGSGQSSFVFPKNSIILKDKKITLAGRNLGIEIKPGQAVALLYPDTTIASVFPEQAKIAVAVTKPKIKAPVAVTDSPIKPEVLGDSVTNVVLAAAAMPTTPDVVVPQKESTTPAKPNDLLFTGGLIALVAGGIGTSLWLRRKKSMETSLADEFLIVE